MQYGLYRDARIVTSTLLLAAAVLFVATSLRAAPLDRLSADFQNQGEHATSAAPAAGGAGGVVVYSKTVEVPEGEEVIYITFSGQADVHTGSALLMNASVGAPGRPKRLCEVLIGNFGAAAAPDGWFTLLKLPRATTGNNCDDGGGGTGDCHDNTIYFSCCARIDNKKKDRHDKDEEIPIEVEIKLANFPGNNPGDNPAGTAFYENATIYIDASEDRHGKLCKLNQ
jgi:hypothetical protein